MTEAEWARELNTLKNLQHLDDKKYRARIAQLARDLERAALEAHRNADRLEGLGLLAAHKARRVRPSEHARTAILTGIGYRDQTDSHLDLISPWIDLLVEVGLSQHRVMRRQAATLLEAAEYIVDQLRWYDESIAELRKRRKSRGGRPPSLMLKCTITMMIRLDLHHNETSERLAGAGIDIDPETLRVERWRFGNKTNRPLVVPLPSAETA